MVLLDPVDSDKNATNDTCLPLLPSLRNIPTIILSLPYSGYNRYYKTTNKNLCAPSGRDARAFYDMMAGSSGGSSGGGGSGGVLMATVPQAGHLQLLDDRLALPIANVCAVGGVKDSDVRDLAIGMVIACCQAWLTSSSDAAVTSATTTPSTTTTTTTTTEDWCLSVITNISSDGRHEGDKVTTSPPLTTTLPLPPELLSSITWEYHQPSKPGTAQTESAPKNSK